MKTTSKAGILRRAAAGWHLFALSFSRLFRSRQTLVCALLLGLASIAVAAWSLRDERTPAEFIEQIFLAVFVSFLLPVFSLCYATAGLAADREERTLVYLLLTPLPRPLVFLSTSAASLLLAAAWTVGGTTLLCWIGGPAGRQAWGPLCPAVAYSTGAYVALFLLVGVTFRRATIIALAYALFIETLIGNMPGIAKRLAISFYTRCLIFDAGAEFGIGASGPSDPNLFIPIAADSARTILCLLGGGLLLAGLLVFTFREYTR